jgi:hypothetical protein
MSLEQFFTEENMYSDIVNTETKNRIKVAVAAYAYEVLNQPIITDGEFDALAKKIDLSVNTRRPDLDKWFRENFSPSTGMWVLNHPDRRILDTLATNILSAKSYKMNFS